MQALAQQGSAPVESNLRQLAYWEKVKSKHLERWQSGPSERPIKVRALNHPNCEHVSGYFSEAKCINNRTPAEMETILGLKPGELQAGAIVQEFSVLPRTDQFEPRGYSHLPGGKPFQEGDAYPPDRGVVQFELNEGVRLPARVIAEVHTGEHFHLQPAPPLGSSASELGNREA